MNTQFMNSLSFQANVKNANNNASHWQIKIELSRNTLSSHLRTPKFYQFVGAARFYLNKILRTPKIQTELQLNFSRAAKCHTLLRLVQSGWCNSRVISQLVFV